MELRKADLRVPFHVVGDQEGAPGGFPFWVRSAREFSLQLADKSPCSSLFR